MVTGDGGYNHVAALIVTFLYYRPQLYGQLS
jgi:hypothetical protein